VPFQWVNVDHDPLVRLLRQYRELDGLRLITAHERPRDFAVRTTSGPTLFVYHYTFAEIGDATLLELAGEVDLPGAGGLAGPLAQRAITIGVDANFAALKKLLETGASRA
jgi:hypothetical protein